ncbi:MAG TPA: hypothetical protein VN696_15830 [Pyrinomonadaceae bacterium]|nr:hypothetical protein [Pyrinomonadaceae bacterium]
MLAIIYLAAAAYFGDLICRRFFRFISIQHRLATGFLVGLLISTWITFVAAVLFHGVSQPLVAGNLVFVALFGLAVFACRRWPNKNVEVDSVKPGGNQLWDSLWLAACLVFVCWLMFATLNFKDGEFQIAFKAWTDFGANVSLTQSFALGKNFPPQHPFFPGEFIRYHFLFWFQCGNLEFLGLNPVWSINLLSVLSLLALMVLIATFGEVVFKSRAVGRIGTALFFFSSSLSYLPFLRSQSGVRGALQAILGAKEFLPSGYPFRGETWGVLSANVFAYQRHLISGIGLFLVALIFAVDEYQRRASIEKEKRIESVLPLANESAFEPVPSAAPPLNADPVPSEAALPDAAPVPSEAPRLDAETPKPFPFAAWPSWIFAGVLIGLLPYWNSPTFIAGLAVFGCLLPLAPLRSRTAMLLVAALVVGLPQVLLLRSGNTTSYSLFNPGYTLESASPWLIVKYLGWTFGVKWILLWVAIVFTAGFQRRLLLALTSLVAIVFLFQLSVDVFNNHKLLNIWATCVNVYAGYALWQIAKQKIVGPILAVLLAIATVFGGFIDLFPLHNDPMLAVPYKNDRLSEWLLTNTQPSDVFLTHTLLTHPILFTGRKIYLGYTLFAWTAGYNVPNREALYREMFQESDAARLKALLHDNNIAYVAIDDGVRRDESLPDLNEYVFDEHFEKVFEDTAHAYDNLGIYKVVSEARP